MQTGTCVDTKNLLTSCRLYKNLGEHVPFVAFYDVKNARLCNVFDGECLTHREPLLDVEDFKTFLKLVGPLMKSGRDSMWVLPGRTPTNLIKI